ncbi:sigma 54-interacting transcriptional regulator [Pendulispora brunnea]|uniref:Sigma 54-interacting transcriptional regulator n=1 Tax=Pendulispora brunnea TaxID=2905690 RepID=A0ABZ2KFT9_9BACT
MTSDVVAQSASYGTLPWETMVHGTKDPNNVDREGPTDIVRAPASVEGFRLLVLLPSGDGGNTMQPGEVPLPEVGELVLGRGEDCAVPIGDASVSRQHAVLLVSNGNFRIRDLESRNGIFVRGRRLEASETVEIGPGEAVDLGRVTVLIQRRSSESPRRNVPTIAPPPASSSGEDAAFVVCDPAMLRLHDLVRRVAVRDINVLLLGETGVGKEVVAEAVHRYSRRADGPLVRVNCAQYNPQLLESELFGHEQGAFTGATRAKAGVFEAAQGGTLFLDEIGELPISAQVKLLRVIEERRIRRVGGTESRELDIRLVTATHRDLKAESQNGQFRRDLYFRLSGVTIPIPPLRERPSEIVPLAKMFAARFAAPEPAPELTDSAQQALLGYPWPGNVRELRNAVEQAVALSDGAILPEHLRLEQAPPSSSPSSSSSSWGGVSPPSSSPSSTPLRGQMQSLERQRIVDALERSNGNQSRAAELLGMPRRTLVDKLRRYNIPRPRSGGD